MRYDVINLLIKKHGLRSYLEIGYQHGINFDQIVCAEKISVDLNGKADFNMGSDHYFEHVDKSRIFDLVFIDGLHHSDQVERDIINAINVVKAKWVVVHDCNPPIEAVQRVPRETKQWYGDVWRAFVGYRAKYGGSYCLDQDCGCGIIEVKGKVESGFISQITWEEFSNNKRELLGLTNLLK